MIRNSERLTAVYKNLLPQKDVWDICCDHGYLGAAAYKSTQFANIYFVDCVPSVMEKLKKQFQKFVYKVGSISQANFICKAGQLIESNVTGTICITGVGGLTVFEILDGLSQNNFLNADRLILGPHRDETKLIELMKNSVQIKKYHLKTEIKVVENNINCKLYIFDRTL